VEKVWHVSKSFYVIVNLCKLYAVNASVSAGVVSYRSWFRVALCTGTSPGINDVSCVRVVKSSWPDSLSQRRVKIRSVWSASVTTVAQQTHHRSVCV